MDRLLIFAATLSVVCGTLDDEPKCGGIPIMKNGKHERAGYRIVGGENAVKGEFPWQVLLQHQGIAICGASIISPYWILTAAHCVKKNFGTYTIRAGEYNLKGDEGIEQEIEVLRIVKHPHYDIPTFDNDIAALELVGRLNFTKFIQPICLPEPGETPKRGTECHISGWGKVSSAIPRSTVLQKISVPVNDFPSCKRQFNKYYPPTGKRDHPRVNGNMICAGFPEGGIDACKGDSGGPMACPKSIGSAMVLYGITSWGVGCGSKLPGYYTRVGNYVEWVRDVISGQPSDGTKYPCRGGGVVIKDQFPVAIKTDGFDGKSFYQPNSHCTWTVEIPGSEDTHVAMLKFTNFDVEPDPTCNYDYVKVFTGAETELSLGAHCGNTTPTALVSENSLKFKIVFHSDDNTNLKGFTAEITRKSKALAGSNCGSLGHIKTRQRKLFPESGLISSAHYPENYLSGSACEWNIRTTPGHKVELTFDEFRLEGPNGNDQCASDSVTVYDAKQQIHGKEIGTPLCGTYENSFTVFSRGRHVTVKFKTDNESESRGFKARYRIVKDQKLRTNNTIPQSMEAWARSQADDDTAASACGISVYERLLKIDASSSQLVEGKEMAANTIPWAAHVHYCHRNLTTKGLNETICKICDGTLIDKKWVATVAHCFYKDTDMVSLNVIVGDHDKNVDEDSERKIEAVRYVAYPTYNHTTLPVNDIALVELKESIKPCKEIRPICLPSPDICFPPGTVCRSTGWGGPATYGADARKIRGAQVPLYTEQSCLEAVGKNIYHKSILCGGLQRGPNHKDQCGPEAGGGLMCRAQPGSPWMLYGIVSCGYGCITLGSPSLYTKVSVLSDWITNVMGHNSTKPPMEKKNSCIAKSNRIREEKNKLNPCVTPRVLETESGWIESQDYPEPYGDNLQCQWTIKSPHPNKFVKITFEALNIEKDLTKCWDQVTVHRANGSIIGDPLCGDTLPALPFISLGNATIKFQSDGSGQFQGFKLKYEMVDDGNMDSNCQSDYFLEESGIIHSFGYPKNYPPSWHCEWLLKAKSNHQIKLAFDSKIMMESKDK